VTQIEAGGASEQDAEKVVQIAGGRRAERRAHRIGLHPRDELVERMGGNLRPDRQPEVERRQLRHRREIVDRIVVEGLVDVLVHGHRRDRGDQQRAPVGRRVLDRGDADASRASGTVFHDDRAAE
jgi:hypothetical protein